MNFHHYQIYSSEFFIFKSQKKDEVDLKKAINKNIEFTSKSLGSRKAAKFAKNSMRNANTLRSLRLCAKSLLLFFRGGLNMKSPTSTFWICFSIILVGLLFCGTYYFVNKDNGRYEYQSGLVIDKKTGQARKIKIQ